MNSVNDGASVLQWAAVAHSVRAAHPTSVDQPSVSAVLHKLLGQHLGVLGGMPHQEGLAKAR